jgi:hypothetical protein
VRWCSVRIEDELDWQLDPLGDRFAIHQIQGEIEEPAALRADVSESRRWEL